jgi:hypothetical protein
MTKAKVNIVVKALTLRRVKLSTDFVGVSGHPFGLDN